MTLLYDGRIELKFHGGWHRYTVDGKIVPSVSSITDTLHSPALTNWAASVGAEWFRDNVFSHGRLIEAQGGRGILLDELHIKAIYMGIKGARRERAEATIGTIAHEYAEQDIRYRAGLGPPPQEPINDLVASAVDAYKKFQKDHEIVHEHVERKLYSEASVYAGTTDFVGTIDGERCIADWKTSRGVYDTHFLQLAAYRRAWWEETGEDLDRILVRFPKDSPHPEIHKLDKPSSDPQYGRYKEDIECFLALRRAWEWKNSA
jgi:hypothetical protein